MRLGLAISLCVAGFALELTASTTLHKLCENLFDTREKDSRQRSKEAVERRKQENLTKFPKSGKLTERQKLLKRIADLEKQPPSKKRDEAIRNARRKLVSRTQSKIKIDEAKAGKPNPDKMTKLRRRERRAFVLSNQALKADSKRTDKETNGGRRFSSEFTDEDIAVAIRIATRATSEKGIEEVKARDPQLVSPLAYGNVGHQAMHRDLVKAFGPEDAKLYGVHLPTLRLITELHDLAKVELNRTIGAEVKRRLDKTNKDGILNLDLRFLKELVQRHSEEAVFGKLIDVAKQIGRERGWSKSKTQKFYRQVVYMAFEHNFLGKFPDPRKVARKDKSKPPTDDELVAELRKLYPDKDAITDEDLRFAAKSFWYLFNARGIRLPNGVVLLTPFNRDMGLKDQSVAGSRGAVGGVLARNDRLDTMNPDKYLDQNSLKGFNLAMLKQTFTGDLDIANPTYALLKLANANLLQFRAAGGKDDGGGLFMKYALQKKQQVNELGAQLIKMQEDNKNTIGADEANHTLLFKSKSGQLYKIDGNDPVTNQPRETAIVYKRVGGKWEKVPQEQIQKLPGNPKKGAAVLMGFARQEGLWWDLSPGDYVTAMKREEALRNQR